jgi:hypothetical protein
MDYTYGFISFGYILFLMQLKIIIFKMGVSSISALWHQRSRMHLSIPIFRYEENQVKIVLSKCQPNKNFQ